MILRLTPDEFRPLPVIEALIATHGLRKVLAAAAVALWRGRMRKSRPPDVHDLRALNAHLRADIGLPPADLRAPGMLPPGPPLYQPGARLG